MHIKLIRAQCFKSFKRMTTIDFISPKFNIFCGDNGSGKSNLVQCVEYLMSDEYYPLKEAQRLQIRSDSASKTQDTIVEIVFDNSDGRFPIPEDNVSIERRTGTTKDEFALNKKHFSRQELISLFESAGISRLNPYFIVKQGRINQLATTTSAARLELLKDIAGIKVYEQHKLVIEQLLSQSKNKMEALESSLANLDERLEPLEEEARALMAYKERDKEIRAIEYILIMRQMELERTKIKRLRGELANMSRKDYRAEHRLAEEELLTLEENLKEMKKQLIINGHLLENFYSGYRDMISEKAKLESEVADLESLVPSDENNKQKLEKQLKVVNEKINEKLLRIQEIQPKMEELRSQDSHLVRQLSLNEQKRSEMFKRQRRNICFPSREKRDEWIRSRMTSLKETVQEREAAIDNLNTSLEADKQNIIKLENRISLLKEELKRNVGGHEDSTTTMFDLRQQKDRLVARRADLWRKEIKLQDQSDQSDISFQKSEKALSFRMGKSIYQGWKSLETVLNKPSCASLQGSYHGLVIENFTSAQPFDTLIDTVGGNRLFYHIVSDSDTASKIIDAMKSFALPGEVFFVARNKVPPLRLPIKEAIGDIGRFLIEEMHFEESNREVFEYLFGRSVILKSLKHVRDLFEADKTAIAVTLDGDKVSPSGAMTGGYISQNKARLNLYRAYKGNEGEVYEYRRQVESCKHEAENLTKRIEELDSKISISELEKSLNRENYERINVDIRMARNNIIESKKSIASKEDSLLKHKAEVNSLIANLEELKNELEQDMPSSQTFTINHEVLNRLNAEVRKLSEARRVLSEEKKNYEMLQSSATSLLEENLYRRKEEITQELQALSFECREQNLESARKRYDEIESKTLELHANIQKLLSEANTIESQIQDLTMKLETKRSSMQDLRSKILNQNREELKRRLLIEGARERLVQSKNYLSTFGTVPWRFSKYQKHTIDQLRSLLIELKTSYDHQRKVDFKSIALYQQLTAKKEEIQESKVQRIAEYSSIKALIDKLDQTKTEAIVHTLTQVSNSFSAIFNELVGAHSEAKLTISAVPRNGSQSIRRVFSPDDSIATDTEAYVGLDICCSFDTTKFEIKNVRSLSGGQKTLVALALVLAIQECDPSPFYIFDEIDQALDPEYRHSVGKFIKAKSKDSQFIASTFRPEFLNYADNFFKMQYFPIEQCSRCRRITKNEAISFMTNEEQ